MECVSGFTLEIPASCQPLSLFFPGKHAPSKFPRRFFHSSLGPFFLAFLTFNVVRQRAFCVPGYDVPISTSQSYDLSDPPVSFRQALEILFLRCFAYLFEPFFL